MNTPTPELVAELVAELLTTADWLEERAAEVEKLGTVGWKAGARNPRASEEAARLRGRAVVLRTVAAKGGAA